MMALLSEDKNCTMKKSIEGTTNNKKRLSVQETKSGKVQRRFQEHKKLFGNFIMIDYLYLGSAIFAEYGK